MKAKRHTPDEIIRKLREAESLLAQGKKVPEVARVLGISEMSFYRWRKRYGDVDEVELKRLRKLKRENSRLKEIVADLTLENSILREAARGNS